MDEKREAVFGYLIGRIVRSSLEPVVADYVLCLIEADFAGRFAASPPAAALPAVTPLLSPDYAHAGRNGHKPRTPFPRIPRSRPRTDSLASESLTPDPPLPDPVVVPPEPSPLRVVRPTPASAPARESGTSRVAREYVLEQIAGKEGIDPFRVAQFLGNSESSVIRKFIRSVEDECLPPRRPGRPSGLPNAEIAARLLTGEDVQSPALPDRDEDEDDEGPTDAQMRQREVSCAPPAPRIPQSSLAGGKKRKYTPRSPETNARIAAAVREGVRRKREAAKASAS